MGGAMAGIRDWKEMRDMSARLLKERTGEDVDAWNRRVKKERFNDEKTLRVWLTKQGVTGFTTRDQVDSEALDWLQRAYDQNR